jgi:hypothetical protein
MRFQRSLEMKGTLKRRLLNAGMFLGMTICIGTTVTSAWTRKDLVVFVFPRDEAAYANYVSAERWTVGLSAAGAILFLASLAWRLAIARSRARQTP